MYDLIILGGGPAGIAAGVYASRKRINALLLARDFGGQALISGSIENFIGFKSISGFDFAKALEDHLREQNAIDIRDGIEIVGVKKQNGEFLVKDSRGREYISKNLLIAFGSSYKELGVPGEKEYRGKGVFYCSICDAPIMKGKNVAVVGGGNSGLGAVIDLLPYAAQITVLEFLPRIKADPILFERAKESGKVNFITGVKIKEIKGVDFVEKIIYEESNSGKMAGLDVSGIFVEVGYKPNSDIFYGLTDMNERGEIITDSKTQKTSCAGVWAAGDITDSLYNQINPAIGDGVRAVLNIWDEMSG